jgi:hypothetical protein
LAVPRHHHHHLVGLLLKWVIHLRMETVEHHAVLAQVLFSIAEVLGKQGRRLAQIGPL